MTQPIKTKPTDDGGSAFPHGEIIAEQHDSSGNFSGNIVQHESAGMSLRDWFAGMAMNGILSNPNIHPGEVGDAYVKELSQFFANAIISKGKQKP
jgi:hypothetical protein